MSSILNKTQKLLLPSYDEFAYISTCLVLSYFIAERIGIKRWTKQLNSTILQLSNKLVNFHSATGDSATKRMCSGVAYIRETTYKSWSKNKKGEQYSPHDDTRWPTSQHGKCSSLWQVTFSPLFEILDLFLALLAQPLFIEIHFTSISDLDSLGWFPFIVGSQSISFVTVYKRTA
jgi:hypothetical protein